MFSEIFGSSFEILNNFFNYIKSGLPTAWQILKLWWWLPIPFILWKPFLFLWLWWRNDTWMKKQKFVLLEIKIPEEILKPMRAMETVMLGLRQTIYQPPDDWWEKWIEGLMQLSYSFEIASIGGEPHFFIRIPEPMRDSAESLIYSQYPDAEIYLADDYTKYVPNDIPSKDWDMWGGDYRPLKPNPYPIKTYIDFETEREAKEEKRIDPLAGLLEAMAKINPGEQLWVQFMAKPITDEDIPWITEGEKIRDELAKREEEKKPSFIGEAINLLFKGVPPGYEQKREYTAETTSKGGERKGKISVGPKSPKKEIIPAEMRMTPGERDVITGIEKKISKPGFRISSRFIYLGKKDVFFKPKLRLVFGYFAAYGTENLNYLAPWGKTLTKIHKSWFLPLNLIRDRRLYLRKRKLFRKYKGRIYPLFPAPGKWPSSFVLNVEELASMYHFPGRGAAPAPFIKRVETRKGEAPPGLPVE